MPGWFFIFDDQDADQIRLERIITYQVWFKFEPWANHSVDLTHPLSFFRWAVTSFAVLLYFGLVFSMDAEAHQ